MKGFDQNNPPSIDKILRIKNGEPEEIEDFYLMEALKKENLDVVKITKMKEIVTKPVVPKEPIPPKIKDLNDLFQAHVPKKIEDPYHEYE